MKKLDFAELKVRPDGYTRATRNGVRKLVHVWIWEDAHGPIPKGYEIHHKNFKRADNRLSNFQLLTELEHKRIHGGCKKLPNGDWKKPCRACKKTKLLSRDFYHRKNGVPLSECKPCHVRRSCIARRERKAHA